MMKRKNDGQDIRKRFLWMLMVLTGSLVFHVCVAAAHRKLLQQGIAEEVIRFHVLANSDEREDQEVKLYVRDAVLRWIESSYETEADNLDRAAAVSEIHCADKQAAQQFLFSHLDDIQCVAAAELQKHGFFYEVQVKLEQCYFSERTYGSCSFPAGWYQTLRICLGEARGHNWWCVLYPKLSFSDCIHAVTEDGTEQELKEILTVEEYEELVREPKQWQIKFRWLSWLNEMI